MQRRIYRHKVDCLSDIVLHNVFFFVRGDYLNHHDLFKLIKAPTFDQIDIKELLLYFEHYVCSKKFRYKCIDQHGNNVHIELISTLENFAHLAGIDKCVDKKTYPTSNSIIKGIRDENITKKYLKNVSITKSKSPNAPCFKDAKKRMRYLSIMNQVLTSPSVFRFFPSKTLRPTNIKSKYLCIEISDGQYIHFGLDEFNPPRKQNEIEFVFPRTLLIENDDTFFGSQEEYRVIQSEIIEAGPSSSISSEESTS